MPPGANVTRSLDSVRGTARRDHCHRRRPPRAAQHRPPVHRRALPARASCGRRSMPPTRRGRPSGTSWPSSGWLGLHLPEDCTGARGTASRSWRWSSRVWVGPVRRAPSCPPCGRAPRSTRGAATRRGWRSWPAADWSPASSMAPRWTRTRGRRRCDRRHRHHRSGPLRQRGRRRRPAGRRRRRGALVRRVRRGVDGRTARVPGPHPSGRQPHVRRRGDPGGRPAAGPRSRQGRAPRRRARGGGGRRRGRLVRRHRRRLRGRPPAVRSTHRPVPGGEAPLRRHARRSGAGARRGLGRGPGPRRRRRATSSSLSAAAAGAVALDAFADGRQGLHPGARRHRVHLGARRPPLPAARDGRAPAAGRRRSVAPRHGRSRHRRRPSPADARPAARGRGMARRRPRLRRRGGAAAPRGAARPSRRRGLLRAPLGSAVGSRRPGRSSSW